MKTSNDMTYGRDYRVVPATSVNSGLGLEVLLDLFFQTIQIVNVCFVGYPDMPQQWVLVDAGTPGSYNAILQAAEKRFGKDNRPKAIILTHGHFDHVGAVIELIEYWDVPVYAHELEFPYLTGERSYPQPDASVEGGMVAKMSPIFPTEPIQLGNHVKKLPDDGRVPEMSGWKWIHVPGHSPGQVALFREEDRSLIAADAFVTVKQEYLYKVITQEQEISGPPRYLTTDWDAARESVKKLESLKPTVAITGHGVPMTGEKLTSSLKRLVEEFDQIAIPDYGRYVKS